MRNILIVLLSASIMSGSARAADLGPGTSREILSAIEKVATRFYSGKALDQVSPDYSDPRRVGFNLCEVYATGMGLDGQHFEGAVDVAAFIVLLRAELNNTELRTTAEPYLQRLEAIAVDRLDGARGLPHKLNQHEFYSTKNRIWESLASALNKTLIANGMSSGDRYFMQECGGGEIHVRLLTRPGSAKVYVIKLFDYILCDVRHIDPADTERCFGWMPNAPDVLDMSGWYQYQAIWPDGKITVGRFSVTEKLFNANADEDKPLVLTLSR